MSAALISSLSVDALLAARDAMHEAVAQARSAIGDAAARLAAFGIEPTRFEVCFPGNERRELLDDRYAEAIRREIDRRIWLAVLRATNVDTLMDSETRRQFEEKLYLSPLHPSAREANLPELTKENLLSTWDSLAARAGDFFERCVESVYRSLSWNHKTNTPGLFGEKLIVRCTWPHSIQNHGALLDLERVLCLLDKRPAPAHETGLRAMKDRTCGEWHPIPCAGGDGTALMALKRHKKGTAHVRILRPDLVRAMNAIMARRHPGQIGTGRRAHRKAGAA